MATTRLLVNIEASSAKLVSEVEKSRKSIQGMKNDLQLIKFDSIVNLGERFFRAGQQAYDFTKSIASAANDIQRNARTVNMSTAEYQQWTYVAKMADLQTEDLMNGIKFLTKSMAATLQGTGDAAKAFSLLGINLKDSSGKTKDQKTVMLETIGALGKFEDGVNRDALMLATFGRSWMTIKPLVDAGTGAIEDWQKEAVKMGTVIGDVILEKGSRAETQFKQLEASINATKISLAPLALAFSSTILTILDSFKQLSSWIDQNPVAAAILSGGATLGSPAREGISSLGTKYQDFLGSQGMGFGSGWAAGGWGGYGTKYGAGKKPEAPGIESAEGLKAEQKALEDDAKAWGEYGESILDSLEKMQLDKVAASKEYWKNRDDALIKAEGELAQVMADEMFPSIEKVSAIVSQGNEHWANQNKLLSETQDLISMMDLESVASGVKTSSSDVERTINQTAIAAQKEVESMRAWMGSIADFQHDLGRGMENSFSSFFQSIFDNTKSWKDKMGGLFQGLADSYIKALSDMAAKQLTTGLFGGSSGGGINWGGLLKTVGGVVSSIFTPSAPVADWATPIGTAEGGVFKSPQLRMIGEAGPEAVIPLDRLEGSSRKEDRLPSQTIFNIMTIDVTTMEEWVRKNSKLFVDVNVDNIRRGGQLAKAVRGA